MNSVNKVILVGHLGADPEIRVTQSGERIANLRLATTESWRDKASGDRKEKTEWHRVTIFNDGLANVAEQHLRKGSLIYIEGGLTTRKWTDKDGQERYSTEVNIGKFNGVLTMLGGRDDSNRGGSSGPSRGREDSFSGRGGFVEDGGDDIPF